MPIGMRELLPETFQNLFYPPLDYSYFEHSAAFPFTSGDTLVKAAWAADASMLAYGRYGATRMAGTQLCTNFKLDTMNCKTIGNWSGWGTQAVFAEFDGFAILAFRGTEKGDLRDSIWDANFIPSLEGNYEPANRVHWGFQQALNQVWQDVELHVTAYRNSHPEAEICFTGHSLGGALAVLAFSRFQDPNTSLYTFGCPRVGNQAFRGRLLLNEGRGVFRFVNYNDAVTHVPIQDAIYTHAPGSCYQFSKDGGLTSNDGSFSGDLASLEAAVSSLKPSFNCLDLNAPAPDSVVDHSPARYCFRLWDWIRLR